MFMLDSCICIDLMRGTLPNVYRLMRESEPSQFKVPAVVAAELYFGAENSSRPAENLLLLERFLQPFEIVSFDDACSKAYGVIRSQLKKAGTPIGPNDMLIAATALANLAVLVTNNDREFSRVKGLRVEVWDEVEFPS